MYDRYMIEESAPNVNIIVIADTILIHPARYQDHLIISFIILAFMHALFDSHFIQQYLIPYH